MDVAELVLHPVRLRLVQALRDGAAATTRELAARLPDVSQATVYRQVAVLAAGGLLEIVGEERVRGAVERRYRLLPARTVLDGAGMTLDDHRRGFAAAVAALLGEFGAYLDRPGADGTRADPRADAVSYRQFPLWLSADERDELVAEIAAAVARRVEHAPSPQRRAHLLSTIFFPTGRTAPPTDQTAPN